MCIRDRLVSKLLLVQGDGARVLVNGVVGLVQFRAAVRGVIQVELTLFCQGSQIRFILAQDVYKRQLWAFLPDWLEEETWQQGEECPLCALEVETPLGAGLTHRDYLGSLMGLGLTREKLGDILLSQQGAQVVVLREVLPILLSLSLIPI